MAKGMTYMVADMRTDASFGPMTEEQADELIALAVGTLREGAYAKVKASAWSTWGDRP